MSKTDEAMGERAVWFDALAHTVTTDGDWPRCAEYGAHEDCQPEQLREWARERAAVAS